MAMQFPWETTGPVLGSSGEVHGAQWRRAPDRREWGVAGSEGESVLSPFFITAESC